MPPLVQRLMTHMKVAKQNQMKTSQSLNNSKVDHDSRSPIIPVSIISDNTSSAIFNDDFMARIQSQSVSYTPEWFQYAYRRSTTVGPEEIGGGPLMDGEQCFEDTLAKYADQNTQNESAMLKEIATSSSNVAPLKTRAKKVMKIKVAGESRTQSLSRSLSLRSPTTALLIGGDTLPGLATPNMPLTQDIDAEIGAVTPEAVRLHLEENWNNLSLARARNASNFSKARSRDASYDENHLSLARARNVSNWKSLSLARSRGISSSVHSMCRENSLSLSMALVSFQYALMRRSTVTPLMTDEGFALKLEEFAEEHEKLIAEQSRMFEKLTPNVKCYTKDI